MSSYTAYDFSESLDRAGVPELSVEKAIAAWGMGGGNGEMGEWEGGFVVKLKDGRYAYIWGWCDYTGWGCHDGAQVEYYDEVPPLIIKRGTPMPLGGYIVDLTGDTSPFEQDWDEDPIDLNRYLAGEIPKY